MNKHMIILPVLLTSAVSLHVLSYNLEEPPEIVQSSPMPSDVTATEVPVNGTNESPVNVAVVPTNANQSAQPANNSNTVPASKAPVTQATAAPVDNSVPVPVATPTAQVTVKVQVASGLIPTKNFGEIVREAKQVGGRVDPFLSMKPPEMEKLPELPTPAPTSYGIASLPRNNATTIPNTGPFKGIPNTMNTIPKPPTAYVPVFEDPPVKTTTKPNNTNKNNQVASTNKTTKPNATNSIIFANQVNVGKGLQLTGIVTGNKPLALIKVDNESKVFAVGDLVRDDDNSKIRVIAINFNNQSVTVANSKNKTAKLEINS